MGDLFYRTVCAIGTPPVWLSSRPVVLHLDRVPRAGPLLLAPNHSSPYDVPCLMRSTPRLLDFLSVVEMRRKPIVGPLYRAMNCVFVDRQRRDLPAARALRARLDSGRAVVMFPEGNIRKPDQSVTRGGLFKTGVIKLAQQSGVPIQPCVLTNTTRYSQPLNWLPFQRWCYGINYGELIHVGPGAAEFNAAVDRLRAAYIHLHDELIATATIDT
jgi:1-acyl-sn-glycerol-3-phosphate acyltransferase